MQLKVDVGKQVAEGLSGTQLPASEPVAIHQHRRKHGARDICFDQKEGISGGEESAVGRCVQGESRPN